MIATPPGFPAERHLKLGVNDVADQATDLKAGKPNRAADISPTVGIVLLAVAATLAVVSSLLWMADAATPVLVVSGLLQ